jgi:sulfoxide reductase heme-binding subunit YedZ
MTAQFGALFDTRTVWYMTRATGVVSIVLLTASLVLGIHKNISLVATTFICVHVVTAVIDGFAPIGWVDVVVPFRAAYRPIWLGLGAVAFDLLIAVAITSLLRRHIGPRVWRLVHWTAYACWPVALVHGLGTGTDTKTSWLLGLEFACVAAVVIAVWWRLFAAGWQALDGRRAMAASVSVVAPLLIGAWVLAGPLQPGWARRAGTPVSLLGTTSSDPTTQAEPAPAGVQGPASSPSTSPAPQASTLAPSFDAALSGTLTDAGPDGRGNDTITIDAQLDSGATGSLHMVLSGRALDGGGLSLESSTVTVTGRDSADSFTGTVTGLRGDIVDAHLQSSAGSLLSLELNLVLQGSSVSGTAHGVIQ